MENVYIVTYNLIHPYEDNFCDENCISKVFKSEEEAIKYCESQGKKIDERFTWYTSYREELDPMDELVTYEYEYHIYEYPIVE